MFIYKEKKSLHSADEHTHELEEHTHQKKKKNSICFIYTLIFFREVNKEKNFL